MPDSAFEQPVLLFSSNPDGTVRRLELATVQDGLRALNRGFEGFCLDHPEWHVAFHSLSQAMLDPAPQRVKAARAALDRLASLTRNQVLDGLTTRAGRQSAGRSVH
jgi:hypothetical protein